MSLLVLLSASTKSRSPRPSYVKYRVGQVIKHRRYGYRGVIVGWDESCKAPQHWIDVNHIGHPVRLINVLNSFFQY